MLLNLSNHPAGTWTAAQITAANREFGEIVDMPFPPVNPAASLEEIDLLAEQHFQEILKHREAATGANLAIHLMGEQTFCFRLLKKLEAARIPTVASTNARKAVSKDGVKTSVFEFISFRNYF